MIMLFQQTRQINCSKISKAVFSMLFLLLACGCSNKAVYDSIRNDGQLECQKLPAPEHQECLDRYSQDYKAYQRSRDAVLSEGD